MHDLVITGGTVIDGTGAAAFRADIAIDDGVITEIGTITDPGRTTVDATGLVVTPGFIDHHTHYDGQITWDPVLAPSSTNGVTSVVVGNCGVGFAPVAPGKQAFLIGLMEGVEDIPGVALTEGVRFDWESFPEYMNSLERTPHSLDFLLQVPHDPLRMAVMGDRALAHEIATPADIAAMARIRTALDPRGTLNPGVLLPPSAGAGA